MENVLPMKKPFIKRKFLLPLTLFHLAILIHPSNLSTSENSSLYGTIAVGTPVGTDAFSKKFLDSKVASLSLEADKIISIPDSQAKHLILKHSFSQKISFLLRTINPYLTGSFISNLQKSRGESLTQLLDPLFLM